MTRTDDRHADDRAFRADAETEIQDRLERLRGLRSAWGGLAPAGFTERGREIAASGREITEQLAALMRQKASLDDDSFRSADASLHALEGTIRELAEGIPVAELRSTLPARMASDRQGLLDLLDVLIGFEPEDADRLAPRIGAIDYLITLLCTGDEAAGSVIRFDPVSLTPRLQARCELADAEADPSLEEIEAEFFAAANMDAEDLREEFQLRTLRQRKTELGGAFFASRILRAIVTYNAALLERVASEIVDSGDWGVVDGAGPLADATPSASLFESETLAEIAAATGRRARGAEAGPNPIDRIVWTLDFDYLTDHERMTLRGAALATREDLLGTAILVGLLCRSIAVLSMDLQAVGLSPDEISDDWVRELDELFQAEINANIASDAYKLACALSELKSKFLFAPLADQFRGQRPGPAPVGATAAEPASEPPAADEAEGPSPDERQSARDLVLEALEERSRAHADKARAEVGLSRLPWGRIAAAAGALAAVAILGLMLLQPDGDLRRLSGEQLERVSPYLTLGHRNGQGAGRSFVGTLGDDWLALPAAQRAAQAETLVERLRALGMEQVMIYDGDRRIRIQALGSQPIQIL